MNNNLIGQLIKSVHISQDKEVIVFRTDLKDYIFSTYNDCCNEVWFQHVEGVNALLGATVTEVYSDDWFDVPVTRQDVEEAAFWTIKTNKGWSKIEVRNSHNGYYGGGVGEDETYGIFHGELKEITYDF
jgi:hypothetical protein